MKAGEVKYIILYLVYYNNSTITTTAVSGRYMKAGVRYILIIGVDASGLGNIYIYIYTYIIYCCLKKNQNAPRPSEHPPVRGEKNVKTFSRWDQMLQIVVVVSHIQRIGCQPEKTTLHGGQSRSWSAEQGQKKKESGSAPPPPPRPPRCSFGENKN